MLPSSPATTPGGRGSPQTHPNAMKIGNLMLARANHVPTHSAMILLVADNGRAPVYLRDLGLRNVIDGRHYSAAKADLRFLSRQEEKRFNNQTANPADWTGVSVIEGDAARAEALDLARSAANPAVAAAIRNVLR